MNLFYTFIQAYTLIRDSTPHFRLQSKHLFFNYGNISAIKSKISAQKNKIRAFLRPYSLSRHRNLIL